MKTSASLLLCCLLCGNLQAQQENSSFFQSTDNGERTLKKFYKFTQKFRENNGGRYLSDQSSFLSELAKNYKIYGYDSLRSAIKDFVNPDNSQAENKLVREKSTNIISFRRIGARPDGSTIGSPMRMGEEDIIAYTDIYYRDNVFGIESNAVFNPSGYYLTLGMSGQVKRVPYDIVFWTENKKSLSVCFWGQAGVGPVALSDEELKTYVYHRPVLVGKPYSDNHIVIDNGGPESLVQLSRRVSYPDIYGIDREKLWKVFDPSQAEFALDDLRVGSAALGLNIQPQKLKLIDIERINSSGVLFLKDDGRIVTLIALDDDRAVVIDRGQTRNVERGVLEKRYSGEALIPTKALTQNAGIIADDAVREIKLSSLDAEVPQSVTLRNTGKVPVTLQLEYPLLGVTESKLSKDTLAPGETATLDLKIKWRSILKAPTQNVLVSLQTSDPIVPRLQLAFLLVPPTAPK